MAQYGKNLYATSPYGYGLDSSKRVYGGVFVGEFESDETDIHYSIKGLNVPVNLEAVIDIPWAYYLANSNSEEWKFDNGWNVTSSSATYSRNTTGDYKGAYLSVTCSDLEINFSSSSSASVVIEVYDTYYNSTSKEVVVPNEPSLTMQANTNSQKLVKINNMAYCEKVIKIYHKENTTGTISLISSRIKSANILFELRRKTNNAYSDWKRIETTSEYVNSLQVNFNGSVAGVGETGTLQGYQFRIILMSSDNLVAPSVSSLKITAGFVGKYDKEGFYRMLIDLESFGGDDTVDISSIVVDYNDDTHLESNNSITRCEVRSATSSHSSPDVDNSNLFSAWSPPYKKASDKRVMLNLKENQDLTEGFLITKPLNPTEFSTSDEYNKIISWGDFYLHYNVQQYDPLDPNFSNLNNLSYIITTCVKNDESKTQIPIKKNTNGTTISQFAYTRNGVDNLSISGVEGEDIRFKISLRRKLPYLDQRPSTPYIDLARASVSMDYTEIVSFTEEDYNEQRRNYKGYASAVLGDCSGKDYVYVDGKNRDIQATIPLFRYTLPKYHLDGNDISVKDVTYEIANLKLNNGISSNVSVYWDSESATKGLKTTNTSSKIRSEVYATYDPDNNIHGSQNIMPICYQSRHGLTTKLASPDVLSYDTDTISELFSPRLDPNKEYLYYLNPVSPDNVDMFFVSEKDEEKENRRNLSYQSKNPIHVGVNITAPKEGGISPWFSSEIISDELTINKNGEYLPRTIIIGDEEGELPQIPGDVNIGANPYIIEVLKGSVKSENATVEDSRINLITQKINRELIKESYIMMSTSGNYIDSLPRGRVKSVEFYENVNDKPGVKLNYSFTIIPDEGESSLGSKVRWNSDTKPLKGTSIWCKLEYEKTISIECLIRSDYKENEYSYANIYQTNSKTFSASVSKTTDYNSREYNPLEEWQIPEYVDKTTLELKVKSKNNKNVRCYILDNRVSITLDHTDFAINWHPSIKKGYYYSRRKEGYLYASMRQFELTDEYIPTAKNIEYVYDNGSFVAVQEATSNIIKNSNLLSLDNTMDYVLIDNFTISSSEEALG